MDSIDKNRSARLTLIMLFLLVHSTCIIVLVQSVSCEWIDRNDAYDVTMTSLVKWNFIHGHCAHTGHSKWTFQIRRTKKKKINKFVTNLSTKDLWRKCHRIISHCGEAKRGKNETHKLKHSIDCNDPWWPLLLRNIFDWLIIMEYLRWNGDWPFRF